MDFAFDNTFVLIDGTLKFQVEGWRIRFQWSQFGISTGLVIDKKTGWGFNVLRLWRASAVFGGYHGVSEQLDGLRREPRYPSAI